MIRIAKLVSVLVVVMLFTSTAALAQPRDNSEHEKSIKTVLSKYFDNYFKSYQTLSLIDSSDIVEDTDETYLYGAIHEWELEVKKALGSSYENYSVDLNYQNISIKKDKATVDLLMNLDYQYSGAGDIKSGLYNVNYRFNLRLKDGKWVISGIYAGLNEYDYFKSDVDGKTKDKFARTKREAINQVKEERLKDIPVMLEQFRKSSKTPLSQGEDTGLGDAIGVLATTYSYNATNGSNYAQRFAEASESSRFFYTAGSYDCTNFVSQCVWAAYGGYVASSDTQTKSNISNKVRMVPNVWHAGTGGGTTNWESVSSFWTYTVGSKTVGPKATGYNDGGKYDNISPSSIYVGNVLQFRNGSSGSYRHSVYVSALGYGPPAPWETWWDYIYVCQHSDDAKNRRLQEVITGFGGSNCYMRRLAFLSASFDK